VRAQALTEASARAKTEFLAELAHRVRTPLQTILSALELASPATPTDRQRLGDASGAAVELRQLFTNLMELTQLETGTLRTDPRPVHLRDVLDEIGVRWRETLTARGLLLVPEASGDVVVDDARLHQIADALLDNVARYSQPGVVRLHLTVEQPAITGLRSSDRAAVGDVVLTVSDDGPGLTASQIEAAFEPFTTFGSAASGSGIGLALVRQLASQLGGTVTATGEPGVTVIVRIPGDGAAQPPVDSHEGPAT
jgi:signal transduction histidine kinase